MAGRPEIQEADDPTWEEGELRYRVLAPLAASEKTTIELVDAAARKLGIERAQCYRLIRKLRTERTVSALLSCAGGRSVGTRLLNEEIEKIVSCAIEEFYLKPQRPTISDLVREVRRRCAERRVQAPVRNTVAKRVEALDPREVARRRRGAAYARRKFGRIVGHLREDQPLGLIQVDHTLADIMVVSSGDRRILGRPWLSLAIDVATRMITGFYVSLDAPSALSVALTLSRSVLPKEEYLRTKGAHLTWPVAGLPQALHLDNAKEFKSAALRRGVAEYGIELKYRPPATPHWGGHIERLVGTMMGSLRLLPGATGRSVAERSSNPEATAAMTLDELEAWLADQIVGVYHHSVHRSLGKPPFEAWSEMVVAPGLQRQHPHDPDRFLLDFLPLCERSIQRSGISLFNMTYSDGVLSTFPMRRDQKFIVRYDPRDMSKIYLRDEAGTYWTIPCSDKRMPPISLTEIKGASRRLRAAGERDVHQRKVLESIESERKIVENAEHESRQVRRDRERLRRTLLIKQNYTVPQTTSSADPDSGDEPILPYSVEEWSR